MQWFLVPPTYQGYHLIHDNNTLLSTKNTLSCITGSRSIHLYESHHQFNQDTADALQWLVQSNSVTLPARHTLYWCTMLKLPEMPGKHHMIGYKPKIDESSKRYVHHMMLYECHDEVRVLTSVLVNTGCSIWLSNIFNRT